MEVIVVLSQPEQAKRNYYKIESYTGKDGYLSYYASQQPQPVLYFCHDAVNAKLLVAAVEEKIRYYEREKGWFELNLPLIIANILTFIENKDYLSPDVTTCQKCSRLIGDPENKWWSDNSKCRPFNANIHWEICEKCGGAFCGHHIEIWTTFIGVDMFRHKMCRDCHTNT